MTELSRQVMVIKRSGGKPGFGGKGLIRNSPHRR